MEHLKPCRIVPLPEGRPLFSSGDWHVTFKLTLACSWSSGLLTEFSPSGLSALFAIFTSDRNRLSVLSSDACKEKENYLGDIS